MMRKGFIMTMTLFLLFGVVVSTEDYIDYTADEKADRDLEDLHEFYKILFRRSTINDGSNVLSNSGAIELFNSPNNHLMIRKAQRAPSLRLRFGRSEGFGLPRSNYLDTDPCFLQLGRSDICGFLRHGRPEPWGLLRHARSEPALMPEKIKARLGSSLSENEEN